MGRMQDPASELSALISRAKQLMGAIDTARSGTVGSEGQRLLGGTEPLTPHSAAAYPSTMGAALEPVEEQPVCPPLTSASIYTIILRMRFPSLISPANIDAIILKLWSSSSPTRIPASADPVVGVWAAICRCWPGTHAGAAVA